MKSISHIRGALTLITATTLVHAASPLENDLYRISIVSSPGAPPVIAVEHKPGGITRNLAPSMRIAFSSTDPQLVPSRADGFPGVVGWKKGGKVPDNNIHKCEGSTVSATAATQVDGRMVFTLAPNPYGTARLEISLPAGSEAPSITMGIRSARDGWFSLGFTGLDPVSPDKLDFLYQPLTWSWKRFPTTSCLTEEAYVTTAAAFINTAGFTEGIAPAPEMIPYRYALSTHWNKAGDPTDRMWKDFPADGPKGNSLFALSVRNNAGLAQPALFAPVLGGTNSFLKAGADYQFICKYLLAPGDWVAGSEFLLRKIFKYRNERQNATCSLNDTFDNMLAFAMNDTYSGWNPELKASNYRFDVPGGVKNVSALHPLSLALVTGDPEIYRLRALPMIEYVMSRERFLFSNDTTPNQAQRPSHRLTGPCVDIGELAGLHLMTRGRTSAFAEETKRLFGKTRKLNLEVESGGGSWQDYLARYQIHKDPTDLDKAKAGADHYLKQVFDNYSTSFKDFPAHEFTTDFTIRIYDLHQMYEVTGDKRYLDAAVVGARHIVLWSRSHPAAPDSTITVNPGGKVDGIFPGRRFNSVEGQNSFVKMDVTSRLPEQRVPAWRTSLVGTLPEAENTYMFGPVMLTHHAAWMLRLARESGDTLLRDCAYNAILGRYESFPGYYFTSLETDIYQRADYPMHPFLEEKYNALFYNHVWPHLALLMDFLVSDFHYRSNGGIDFPSVYAPGYAFLSSRTYGHKPGKFMGNGNVRLWMPSRALQSGAVALNHLFGIGEDGLFLALANTSPAPVRHTLRLNPSVIPWNAGQTYQVTILNAQGAVEGRTRSTNGELEVSVPANGLMAYKIEGLGAQAVVLDRYAAPTAKAPAGERFIRHSGPDALTGTTTAMIAQTFPQFADFYLFSDRTTEHWKSARLEYRIGGGVWQTAEDGAYPFEFGAHLPDPHAPLEYKLTATTNDAKDVSVTAGELNSPRSPEGLGKP
jgi:hypothetical protein